MRKLNYVVFFAVQYLFLIGGWLALDLYEFKKEFYRESSNYLKKTAKELNKNIWGIKLSLLDLARSKGHNIPHDEWSCSGIEKIQLLSEFKGVASLHSTKDQLAENVKIKLNAADFHLPLLSENYSGYIIDLNADEIVSVDNAARLHSNQLGLKEYIYKTLISPNLVLLVGISFKSLFSFFLKKNILKFALLFLALCIVNVFFYMVLKKQTILYKNQVAANELLNEESKKLEKSLFDANHYHNDLKSYFLDLFQSVNELSGVLVQSKKQSSSIFLSPSQETNLIEKINEFTSTGFQNLSSRQYDKIDLLDLILEIKSILYSEIKRKSVNIVIHEMQAPVIVESNKLFLATIFLNIINSSLVNSAPNSVVHITVSKVKGREKKYQLEIVDEGFEDLLNISPSNIGFLSLKYLRDIAAAFNIQIIHSYKAYQGNQTKIVFQKQNKSTKSIIPLNIKDRFANVYSIYK